MRNKNYVKRDIIKNLEEFNEKKYYRRVWI